MALLLSEREEEKRPLSSLLAYEESSLSPQDDEKEVEVKIICCLSG